MKSPNTKIITKNILKNQIEDFKGKCIVGIAHGCFDVIGAEHIKFLFGAACNCDVLVCSISSNSVVRKLKGSNRPIFDIKDRMFHLASIEYVDWVIEETNTNCVETIKMISPVKLIKGYDTVNSTNPEWVLEKEAAYQNGGEVVYVVSDAQRHTTEMIDLIPKNELNVFS